MHSRNQTWALVPLIVCGAFSTKLVAAQDLTCVENCGDVNHSGPGWDVIDLTYLYDYLTDFGPPPPCYDEAEWDNYERVTLNDLFTLSYCLPICDFPPPCPPPLPPLGPPASDEYFARLDPVQLSAASGATTAEIRVYFGNATDVSAFGLPLKFRVGSELPVVQSIELIDLSGIDQLFKFGAIHDSGRVYLGAVEIFGLYKIEPGQIAVANVTLGFDSEPVEREITVAWDSLPPYQDGTPVNTPMVMLPFQTYPDPVVFPDIYLSCCFLRGDINHDGQTNVADLTNLVRYLFETFPPPIPCLEEADADGSGTMNISDLTLLVSYLFSGGPPPPPCR